MGRRYRGPAGLAGGDLRAARLARPLVMWADPIKNQTPSNTGLPGSHAVDTLIAWTMWGSLILCVFAGIVAGGFMAVGRLSERPHLAARGQAALFWAVIGAVVVGLAIPLVNAAFGIALT